MVAIVCPNRETLLQYSLGMLPGEQQDALDDHLASCLDCQAMIITLDDADDTVIGRLRASLNSDSFLTEPELHVALAAAMAMPAQMRSPQDTAGLAGQLAFDMPESLGEYRLLEELGRGGMGRVYKALHTKLDRVVAVKVLSLGRAGDRRAIVRFEREMKAVGRLNHPNIVQAYDAREIDNTPVLIMEFVDGLDLAEIVHRVGAVPLADACELIRQTALALQCADEHGLVHRDIKPSNIMLARSGEVKLLDLGLARFYGEDGLSISHPAVGEEMTSVGQAMGTADYMSPEQASDGRSVDIRADLYSLGCTFYKLLSGRVPFSGPEYRTVIDKLNAHLHKPAPFIRRLVPDVPEVLAAILDRLLAKDPNDRFATPAAVAEALAQFCDGADLPALVKVSLASPSPANSRRHEVVAGDGESGRSPQPRSADRGWGSSITRIAIALFIAGFGFALGILITIRRDGKETTVDVPEGSHASVRGDGQIDITVPGQTKRAAEAEQPKRPLLQFGPPVERVVNHLRPHQQGGHGLELASGKLSELPKDYDEWSVEQQDKWCMENNVDLLVDFLMVRAEDNPYRSALLPKGLTLAAAPNHREDLTEEEIRSLLSSPQPRTTADGTVVAMMREKNGITSYILEREPAAFVFQTRIGTLGFLQVLRRMDPPEGLRLRYWLAPPSAAVSTATRHPPSARAAMGDSSWPKRLFKNTSHDFGTVARGTKAEYRFVLTNGLDEDIHIKSLSHYFPDCFMVQLTSKLVKVGQIAEIVVVMDTQKSLGRTSDMIEVNIDAPAPGQVALEVTGDIGEEVGAPGTQAALDVIETKPAPSSIPETPVVPNQ